MKGETDLKTENMYYNQQKRSEVKEEARRLRRKFLRYQQAEIVYNREIFDEYLEQFHEK